MFKSSCFGNERINVYFSAYDFPYLLTEQVNKLWATRHFITLWTKKCIKRAEEYYWHIAVSAVKNLKRGVNYEDICSFWSVLLRCCDRDVDNRVSLSGTSSGGSAESLWCPHEVRKTLASCIVFSLVFKTVLSQYHQWTKHQRVQWSEK